MGRNLMSVIDEILMNMPDTETKFKYQLKDNKSSVSCAAPELMGFWWNNVYETLLDNIPNKPTEEWQYKILSIFSTKSIKELKMAFEKM